MEEGILPVSKPVLLTVPSGMHEKNNNYHEEGSPPKSFVVVVLPAIKKGTI